MSASTIGMGMPGPFELIVSFCILVVPIFVIVGIVFLILKLSKGKSQPPTQPPPTA